MRVVKKCSFTLLEMFVVFTLLAGLGTLLTVSFRGWIEEQQFYSDVRQLKNQLQLSSDLMWLLDADVTITLFFAAPSQEWHSQIQVEKPLEPFWKKLVERPVVFSSLASVSFSGKTTAPQKLLFSLGRMSQGRLEVVARKGGKKAWIDLSGSPSALVPVYS